MIGVVIPVHNEEKLLGDCLDAVRRAAMDPLLDAEPIEVVVVLDACTDRSAAIAIQRKAQIVSLHARCVGAARSLGASLLERKADVRFAGAPRVSTSARWESTIDGGFAAMLRGLREKCIPEAAAEPLAA